MDLEQVRRIAITALFSDDFFVDKLVLKGGNALRLIYHLGSRSSLDIDLSIEDDFSDLGEVRELLRRALTSRFHLAGFTIFDFSFEPRPSNQNAGDRWGGYQLKFKLIESAKHGRFAGNPEQIRRNAFVIGSSQERIFTIDMSKYEYCGGKQELELDGFSIYVYTPAMIAIEKLRAICQQMEAYPMRKHRQPRARDFYDIHLIIREGQVDLLLHRGLIAPIFSAKEVPLDLLRRIAGERDFHRIDWPAVEASVSGIIKDFDYYFDFVLEQVNRLEAHGME